MRHAPNIIAAAAVAVCSVFAFLGGGVAYGQPPSFKGEKPAKSEERTLEVRNGDVWQIEAGKSSRLTTSSLVTDASLSPDGKLIAYVQKIPGKQVATAYGEDEASQIWIMSADVAKQSARVLVKLHESDKVEDTFAAFSNLRFANDGRTLYFNSAAWATSGALKSVNLSSGKVRHIIPSNGFEVLRRGKFAADLVVEQHRYNKDGAYDSCWLFSPEGKEIRGVGDDLSAAVKKLERGMN